MYLITYTIKHAEYEYRDRFLSDTCEYAYILPEIWNSFYDYDVGDFLRAVADLRFDNRYEIDERVLCDLTATKVDDVDVPILTKYLNGRIPSGDPVLASIIPQNSQ